MAGVSADIHMGRAGARRVVGVVIGRSRQGPWERRVSRVVVGGEGDSGGATERRGDGVTGRREANKGLLAREIDSIGR